MNPFSEPSESHGTHYEQCGKINVIAHWINHSFTRWDASEFIIELGKSRFCVSWSVLVCVVEPYSPRSAQAHLARVQELLKAVRPQDALIAGRSPAVLNSLTQTAGEKYSYQLNIEAPISKLLPLVVSFIIIIIVWNRNVLGPFETWPLDFCSQHALQRTIIYFFIYNLKK